MVKYVPARDVWTGSDRSRRGSGIRRSSVQLRPRGQRCMWRADRKSRRVLRRPELHSWGVGEGVGGVDDGCEIVERDRHLWTLVTLEFLHFFRDVPPGSTVRCQ